MDDKRDAAGWQGGLAGRSAANEPDGAAVNAPSNVAGNGEKDRRGAADNAPGMAANRPARNADGAMASRTSGAAKSAGAGAPAKHGAGARHGADAGRGKPVAPAKGAGVGEAGRHGVAKERGVAHEADKREGASAPSRHGAGAGRGAAVAPARNADGAMASRTSGSAKGAGVGASARHGASAGCGAAVAPAKRTGAGAPAKYGAAVAPAKRTGAGTPTLAPAAPPLVSLAPGEWLLSVPTLFGLESLAAREIRDLGYYTEAVENGRVAFKGDMRAICRCNLWLRTAERVQVKMGDFSALTFDSLFESVKALPWPCLLPADAAFPVSGHCLSSKLFSVPDCQAIIKKAVAESMKGRYGGQRCPETGSLYRIQFNIIRDRAELYVDTSGEGLHKRGYREDSVVAPIKETLAAALVKLSGWRPGFGLWDPFCGSGTIVLEAAMMAANIAPGLNRQFAAEQWTADGKKLWDAEREAARAAAVSAAHAAAAPAAGAAVAAADADSAAGAVAAVDAGSTADAVVSADAADAGSAESAVAVADAGSAAPSPSGQGHAAPSSHAALVGSDIERRAVAISRQNAKKAGVAHLVRFFQMDARDMAPDHPRLGELGAILPAAGAVVSNPPYGERLDEVKEAEDTAREWGPALRRFRHWNWNAISAHESFEKNIGRVADKRRKLYNGMIRCYAYQYFRDK